MKMVGNAMMFCFAAWLALHAVYGEGDGCNNGGCVAPTSPPTQSEQEKIHEIQCTLSCVQEVRHVHAYKDKWESPAAR